MDNPIQTAPKKLKSLMWNFTSEQADLWFNLSNIVILVGAVAVALGTFGSIKMGALRDRFADERIAANEAETARAQAVAATAQLELARLKAPRGLTDGQIERMIVKLRPFAGQQFGMITYWNMKEPANFTKQIGNDVLIAAGWKFVKAERFEALVGVVTGIEVELSSHAPDTAKRAAKALVSAFNAEGTRATYRDEPAYTTLIKIQVGLKP